jgi:hypothetical protein
VNLERIINTIVNGAMFNERDIRPILDVIENLPERWDSEIEIVEEVEYEFGR